MAKSKIQYGVGMRTQYPAGFDMREGFREQLEQARLAEKLGFDSLLKNSHFAGYPLQEFQQLPFLGRIMAEAPSLRLLTGIMLLSLQKPLDVAEQLATIDVMSGGKLIFGCGLGYREVEFRGFGTTQRDRVPRFIENLEAVKRLWTEDHVTMKGSHFELIDATLSMKPLQKPTPPIWMGANADVAIERAAELADVWFINTHQRMETIQRQMDVYKRALDKFDKPFPDEVPIAREIFVANSREEAIRITRPFLEEKYKIYHQWGQDKAMPKGDDNLALDYDELLEDRFMLGSPEEIAEQIIAQNRQCGINHLVLQFHWVGIPQNLVLESMTRFAEEVRPLVEQGL
ncbi:MAG: alkanesulfonate monooxygenase SsuD [Alphaproteobacteria bacterium]|jgi:alkanesulfonate monooxygenase SsuD/methylene tetrahydromethanopterin reductase-like flavin-dependent oxidoreductase (luciferase family)